MQSVLDSKLLVVTGKGGVGKTTIAATIGLLAAHRGLRAIVVEVGDQSRLPGLFDHPAREPGVETKLQERLSSISIDPDRALLEWLQALGGRVSGRVLASSGTFQYFAAAAPGASELVSMVKIWELTRGQRWQRRAAGYDLVVLDAPSSGHALGMLRSPHTFGAIARVGPIAGQAQRVRELLEDPARTAYLAVALPTEMAVTETLELQDGLHRQLGRTLAAVIVNGLLPQRFTPAELRRIATLRRSATYLAGSGRATMSERQATDTDSSVRLAAATAAQTVHDRARFQHNQLARLRRRNFDVVGVPFVWGAGLDLPAVQRLAEQLGRKL
ncbi:MAG TPA: ArsA family ATPase [Solirubrobacteraceae bacterium]|nr:ArsA family ATPase [Solirubrobacteraceae bacterium]